MAMTRVKRWGNSYGIRIPKHLLDELGIKADSQVEITQDEGKIVLTPIKESISLETLLNNIKIENLHGETDWGHPVGKEGW